MAEMPTAVVIPVGAGRLNNLLEVMESLAKQTVKPKLVVLVCDGPQAALKIETPWKLPTAVLETPKHEPGKEQPRNIGVALVDDLSQRDARFAGISHVWFLDSDVIVRPRALEYYTEAYNAAEAWRCVECGTPRAGRIEQGTLCEKCESPRFNPAHSIFVGPYDWLPPGRREAMPELRNDPDGVPPPGRWDRFDNNEPDTPVVNDLFAGLACFSGNLVWPIEEFKRVGGFWNEIHHGRCEDGELGVRAVQMGVPITFVATYPCSTGGTPSYRREACSSWTRTARGSTTVARSAARR
jgi:GT2 family glycosyltransferase